MKSLLLSLFIIPFFARQIDLVIIDFEKEMPKCFMKTSIISFEDYMDKFCKVTLEVRVYRHANDRREYKLYDTYYRISFLDCS